MKKRVLAVLLSAAMVASLAVGCGSSSKSDEKSETKTETAKDTKEETKDVEAVEQRTVYVTPTGKRYHYISTCGGKNSTASTLNKAKARGLTPCQKCAQ